MCGNIETDVVRSRESEDKFLIHVYDQMFATINRIHNSIWNIVVIIGGGIGVLKIYSECGYNHTFTFAIIVYITALSWILMRLYDFNYWCNRNLFIIKNIEDRFLGVDAKKIYGNFRPPRCKQEKRHKIHDSLTNGFCVCCPDRHTVFLFLC